MPWPAPLLLLTEATSHRYKPVYTAVRIFAPPQPESDDGWLGAVPGDTHRRFFRVVPPLVETVQATTDAGWIWFEDGRQLPRWTDGQWATAVAGAANRVSLLPPANLELPAFVSGDERRKPCQHRVVVRLLVRTLADLPDTRVTLEFLADHFRSSNAALVGHRAAAQTLRPGPGLDIPTEVDSAGRRIGGVLRIERQLNDSVFSCTLLLGDSFAGLTPGAVLSRHARQDTRLKAFAASADVAEVIEAGVASPLVTITPADPREDVTPPLIPILCLACRRRFEPSELSLEELEVADHWAFRVSFARELRSTNSSRPRAAFLRERVAEYDARLAGRRVTCRHCASGAVSFEPDWWDFTRHGAAR